MARYETKAKDIRPPWRFNPHFNAEKPPTTGYITDAREYIVVDSIEGSIGRPLVDWVNKHGTRAFINAPAEIEIVDVSQLSKAVQDMTAKVDRLSKERE
jgi:hypothetical protein